MDPQSHLLSVLQSHHTPLGPDDVNWAFTNTKSSAPVTEYVDKYLGEETLLSYEESAIIAQLQKTGTYPKLVRSHPTATLPPFTPSRLSAETAHLTALASTLAHQTSQLKTQQSILSSLRSRHTAALTRRRALDSSRSKKWRAERDELQAAIDDMVGMLNEEAADLRESVMGDMDRERAEMQELLERDDRWISRLERLAEEFVMPDSGGSEGEGAWGEEVKQVEKLCETLVRLEEKAVRDRLDAVYLEALEDGGMEVEVDGMEMDGMKAEIEGLHQEIPTVCRGAVFNEFLQPVLAREERERERRGGNWAVGGEYLQHILLHLTSRNDAITTALASSQSRDQAALTILESITAELAAMASAGASATSRPSSPSPSSAPDKDEAPSTPPSALGRRSRFGGPVTPGGLSPNRRFQLTSRRRHSDVLSKQANPDQALLSMLGIALPAAPHVVQLAQKVNDAHWDMDVWDEVEATTWREMAKERDRLYGEGRWPATDKEAEEAGGAMVRIREEVRRAGEEVERGITGVALGMTQSVKEVEKVGEERGRKMDFVERWRR